MRLRLPLNLALATIAALACCAPAIAGTTAWRTSTVSDEVHYAAVGIDGAGSVTTLFTESGKKQIMLSRAAARGEFSDPVPFGPECGFSPTLAVNNGGDAIGIWQQYAGSPDCEGTPPVIGIRIREAGGAFGPTRSLPGAGGPNVAMNASGRAVLTWGASPGAIKVATRLPGGDFGPATVLSGPGAAYPGAACDSASPRQPIAAINNRGDEIVIWSYWTISGCKTAKGGAFASFRPAGGEWGKPEPLPEPGDSQAVSLARNGTATIVFSRPIDEENDTAAITRKPNGDYLGPESLGTRGDVRVTSNESGSALFWWVDGFGAAFQNYGALQEPDGSLTRFKLLHAGLFMNLALDGFGNVLTTWVDNPNDGQRFNAAMVNHLVLANSPPTLAPEVSSEADSTTQGTVVNDAGAAAAAYIEYPDLSVYPPPSRLVVVRRAADVAPPAVEAPPAETAPAAVTTEAKCDEICRVRSTLTVTETPAGGLRAARVRPPVLKLTTRWVARRGGRLARQTIGVGPKGRKRLRKLRRNGVHLTAIATVRAEDAWENARAVRRPVSLKKLLGG